jgi:hypothetical protein
MAARRRGGAPTLLGAAVTLLSAVCWAGCGAVPELQFVSDDASSGDAQIEIDASDGDGADSALESAVEAGACPGPSPSATAKCCAPLWCDGDCGPANCDECSRMAASGSCGAGKICCGTPGNGNLLCKDKCR